MCTLGNLSVARGFEIDVGVLMDRSRLQTDRDGAWRRVWDQFAGGGGGSRQGDGAGVGRTALILHLPNHYALVFGLREYTRADGSRVREVLSARRKQKPKEWFDFEGYIVPLMLGEDGDRCQIVSVRRREGQCR